MYKVKKLDLVILAGGKGSRISKLQKKLPKPMIKFNNIPFLQYQINNFFKYPFENCYILSGYKGIIIHKKFNNKKFNLIKIKNIKEKKPMGTGGALRNLKTRLKNDFILINGDTIFDVDLSNIFTSKKFSKNLITIFLTDNKNYKSNSKLTNLKIGKKNIVQFNLKSKLMNGGIYLCKNKILNLIHKKIFSFEDEILIKLINNKRVNGIYKKNYFIDIGTPENLKKGFYEIPKYFNRPAAFLDRDGVINHDFGYVHKFKNFKFRKGIISALRYLVKNNYYIFIITNQAGIGKKKFTELDFLILQKKINYKLLKKKIFINDLQYCPYHPKALIKKYRKKSNMRKPNNGMIKNIFNNWNIRIKESFFVGDNEKDMLAAKKSNIYFEYAKKKPLLQFKNILTYLKK